MEAWINDGETLLSLVSTSKDSSLDMNAEKSDLEILAELQHLKKDLGMSSVRKEFGHVRVETRPPYAKNAGGHPQLGSLCGSNSIWAT
jgi:hypothetical protein